MNANPRSALPALEPFYYLKNFDLVLSTILDRYQDLLSPDESRFIAEFSRAPQNSRALLTRMVMRHGVLFRASKLNYEEIGDTRVAVAPLIEAGWVDDRPKLGVDELQSILTKRELIRGLGLPHRYVGWRKEPLVTMLKGQLFEAQRLEHWWSGSTEAIYALLIAPMCERFRLMFFGNGRQLWSEFVTVDLKIFRYEKLERSSHSRPFRTRAQIDLFQRLQECNQLLQQRMSPDEVKSISPGQIQDSDWLEDKRQKLLFNIAREHERAGDVTAALRMYMECNHRGARTRAIRLQARARNWREARALCLIAREKPESEAETQQVRRILPRANRKLDIPCDAEPASPVVPEFEIILDGMPGAGDVEYRVRDHLARALPDGNTVRYVENGLINSLFGLLCWPAIFAPVPGAFFHDFHYAPADLMSGHFYQRRQRAFEECFGLLESECYRRAIWKIFKQKWGIQSPFVRWQALDKTLLQWALDCFPAAHLRLWFEWIVRDIQENRAGFPDLVQFWPEERRYRMIEVKGPGDRLQDNQRRLLEYCASHQIPVAVCYARWNEAASA